KSGYRRIGLLTGPEQLGIVKSQIKGYKAALSHYDISFTDSFLMRKGFMPQQGAEAFQKLMRLEPDAVIAGNDAISMVVFREAARMNLQLGVNLGLVSLRCDPVLGLLDPPVT